MCYFCLFLLVCLFVCAWFFCVCFCFLFLATECTRPRTSAKRRARHRLTNSLRLTQRKAASDTRNSPSHHRKQNVRGITVLRLFCVNCFLLLHFCCGMQSSSDSTFATDKHWTMEPMNNFFLARNQKPSFIGTSHKFNDSTMPYLWTTWLNCFVVLLWHSDPCPWHSLYCKTVSLYGSLSCWKLLSKVSSNDYFRWWTFDDQVQFQHSKKKPKKKNQV